jgi:hypothetical protein
MAITHAKEVLVADGVDTTIAQPSDWNADHVIADASISIAKLDFTPAVAADITAAIATHAGLADPHTGYLKESDAGALALLSTVGTSQIDADAVTYAKIQNVSATDKLLGRSTAGAGDVEEITCTAAGRALLDDAAASDQRTTLGLGTLATQSGTFSGTSSGTNTGDQTIQLTGDVTGSGTGSFAATLATNYKTRTITVVIDGGGSAITTGVKCDLEIPFACTINRVTMLADQSGSIVVDIWKDTYANYPPTVADTITASAKPTITTATKSQDSTLTGWTATITAGDTLRFNVDSITTCTRVTLSLKVTVTA